MTPAEAHEQLKAWSDASNAAFERRITQVAEDYNMMCERAENASVDHDNAEAAAVIKWAGQEIDIPPETPLTAGRVSLLALIRHHENQNERAAATIEATLRASLQKTLSLERSDLN